MPKLLIISACLVAYADDRGGVHADQGDIVDVPKDQAVALTTAERALYVAKDDDHTKVGRYTADKDLLAAAEAARAAAAEAAAATAAQAAKKA